MGKLFKLVVVAGFAACLLYAGSYAGARATVGKFMGTPLPEMGAECKRTRNPPRAIQISSPAAPLDYHHGDTAPSHCVSRERQEMPRDLNRN